MVELKKLTKKQLIKQLQVILKDMERAKDEGEQQHLIHDLSVHQIELEMQNRELLETQLSLEISRNRYSELYDFAPVGYVTLTDKGCIEQINLTGAKLLGKSPGQVTDLPLSAFVFNEDLQHLFKYLNQVFNSDVKVATELRLKTSVDSYCHVYMESIAVCDRQGKVETCRSVIVDISERKQAEEKTQELLQQNRNLTQRLFKAQEEERRHIARELHDEFGQWLTAIQLNVQNITNLIGKPSPDVDACIVSIANSASHIQKDIHGMIHNLWPTLLDELGLTDSLRELVAQWQELNPNTVCALSLEGKLDDLGEILNITIYRLVQEGLTNVTKHALAKHVAVKLHRKRGGAEKKDHIVVTVEDDGRGIDSSVSTTGIGLASMRERVLAAGGTFSFHGPPRKGVRLEARLLINSTR
jgi:PAS domain S-box-containing protein